MMYCSAKCGNSPTPLIPLFRFVFPCDSSRKSPLEQILDLRYFLFFLHPSRSSPGQGIRIQMMFFSVPLSSEYLPYPIANRNYPQKNGFSLAFLIRRVIILVNLFFLPRAENVPPYAKPYYKEDRYNGFFIPSNV